MGTEVFERRFDDFRVELSPRASSNFLSRFIKRNGRVIWPLVDHRVDRIHNHKNAGTKGDLVAAKASWVAGAIEFFMMRVHDFGGSLQEFDAAQKLVSILRMASHGLPLIVVEFRRFPKNAV